MRRAANQPIDNTASIAANYLLDRCVSGSDDVFREGGHAMQLEIRRLGSPGGAPPSMPDAASNDDRRRGRFFALGRHRRELWLLARRLDGNTNSGHHPALAA
jgi:hypothetical protein